jgi:hypothetical protein
VFTYVGSPNWMLITVDAAHRAEMRAAKLVMDDGKRIPLRWFQLDASGTSGGGVAADLHHASALRVLPAPGGEPLVARFGS